MAITGCWANILDYISIEEKCFFNDKTLDRNDKKYISNVGSCEA